MRYSVYMYRAVFSLKKEKAVLGVYICLALIYHVDLPRRLIDSPCAIALKL